MFTAYGAYLIIRERVVDQRLHRLWGEEKQVVPPGCEIAISVVVVNLLQCRQDHPLVTSTREWWIRSPKNGYHFCSGGCRRSLGEIRMY